MTSPERVLTTINNNSSLFYEVCISCLEFGEQSRTLGPLQRLRIEDFFEKIAELAFIERSYNVKISCKKTIVKIVGCVPEGSYIALLGPVAHAIIYLGEEAKTRVLSMPIPVKAVITEEQQRRVVQAIRSHYPLCSTMDSMSLSDLLRTIQCYCASILEGMTLIEVWEILKNVLGKEKDAPLPEQFHDEYRLSMLTL